MPAASEPQEGCLAPGFGLASPGPAGRLRSVEKAFPGLPLAPQRDTVHSLCRAGPPFKPDIDISSLSLRWLRYWDL